MSEPLQRRTVQVRSPWFGGALVVGAFVVYATTLRSYFQGDDYEAVLDVVRRGPRLSWLTQTGAGLHVRPVLWLHLWASHRVFGMDPLGWHVTNVLSHAVVAWLVAVLADVLLRGAGQEDLRRVVPPIAGALFLVSPAHAETVSWIVARVDLITATFCILSLLAWIRWQRSGGAWVVASFVAFALALYTKEAVLSFPVVLLAHSLWHLPPKGDGRAVALRRTAVGLAPPVALLVAYLVRYVYLDDQFVAGEGATLTADGPVLVGRRGVQVVLRSVLPPMPSGAWIAVGAVAVGLVAVVAMAWRRWELGPQVRPHLRTFGFLVSAVAVMVAPVARLGVSPFTTAGDRLAYVPSVFSTIAVAMVVGLVVQRLPRIGRVLVPALVVVAALLLVVANGTYVRGGQMMEGVVGSQGEWPVDQPVVALAVPDTLEGSWGARDALGSSLVLVHGWSDPAAYHEVSAVQMQRWDDTITVRRGSCTRCLVLHLDAPKARFMWPAQADVPVRTSGTQTTVTRIGDRDLEVRIDPGADLSRYWYVSGGRYVRLAPLASLPR